MKRIAYFLACTAASLCLVSCGANPDASQAKNPVMPKAVSFDDLESRHAVREQNPVDKSFIDYMGEFSYDSASKILKGGKKNINYSPISLYMTLSLAGTGANGKTRDEIFSALYAKGKDNDYPQDNDYISLQNGNLFRLLYCDNEIGKLKLANSLWLQKDIKFNDSFVKNGVDNFYASLFNVDFADKKTGELMGKWILDNTNGILSPKLETDSSQIMSIINTIYFKDQWTDKFDEKSTKQDTFYLEDGSQVKCDFMNSEFISHAFIKGDGFTSSSLGLKNNGSMIFILPDKGIAVDNLLSSPEKLSSIFNSGDGQNGKVKFKIPKFSFGSNLKLNDVLKSMGVKSAFERDADFTGITDGTVFISSVEQQSHIAIDEKGVEAAAFTDMMYAGSAMPTGSAEMILDRPFIYAIRSNTGAILFIGVVNNPAEGK